MAKMKSKDVSANKKKASQVEDVEEEEDFGDDFFDNTEDDELEDEPKEDPEDDGDSEEPEEEFSEEDNEDDDEPPAPKKKSTTVKKSKKKNDEEEPEEDYSDLDDESEEEPSEEDNEDDDEPKKKTSKITPKKKTITPVKKTTTKKKVEKEESEEDEGEEDSPKKKSSDKPTPKKKTVETKEYLMGLVQDRLDNRNKILEKRAKGKTNTIPPSPVIPNELFVKLFAASLNESSDEWLKPLMKFFGHDYKGLVSTDITPNIAGRILNILRGLEYELISNESGYSLFITDDCRCNLSGVIVPEKIRDNTKLPIPMKDERMTHTLIEEHIKVRCSSKVPSSKNHNGTMKKGKFVELNTNKKKKKSSDDEDE